MKGIYIYCVMKKLEDGGKKISNNLKEKIIKTICTQVSLLLAFIFCEFIKDKFTNIWLFQIFLRETEDSLAAIERRDG